MKMIITALFIAYTINACSCVIDGAKQQQANHAQHVKIIMQQSHL